MPRIFISHWECGIPGCSEKNVSRDWDGRNAGNRGMPWPMCPNHNSPMVMISNSYEGTLDVSDEEDLKL